MSKKIGRSDCARGYVCPERVSRQLRQFLHAAAGVVYVLTQGTTGIGNNVTSFAMNLANGNLTEINDNASTCPTTATLTNPEPCEFQSTFCSIPSGATGFVLNQGIPCPEVLQNGVYVCGTVPGSNPPVAAVPVPPTIYPYVTYEDGSLSSPGTPAIWTCPSNPTSCTYSDSALNMTRDAAGRFLFVISHGSYPSPGYPEPTLTIPSLPHAPSGQHPEPTSARRFRSIPVSPVPPP